MQVEAIAVSADCVRCVVACGDGHIYVYNLRSGELLFTFSGAAGGQCDGQCGQRGGQLMVSVMVSVVN